jgi:hypothetical protein
MKNVTLFSSNFKLDFLSEYGLCTNNLKCFKSSSCLAEEELCIISIPAPEEDISIPAPEEDISYILGLSLFQYVIWFKAAPKALSCKHI